MRPERTVRAACWSDVELAAGKVHLRRNLSMARGATDAPIRPRFFEPKTKAGIRTIPIAPEVVLLLKEWKLQCPKAEHDLVFPLVDGQPNTCDCVLSCDFYPALRRAKLRKVKFHSLRHSCASAMIAAGRPITEIQHRLGHASPAITLKVYSHFFKDAETPTSGLPRWGDLWQLRSEKRGMWAQSGH
jgi:integrase